MIIMNKTPLTTIAFPIVDDDGDLMLTVVAKGTFDIVPGDLARFSAQPSPIRITPVRWDMKNPSSVRYEDDLAPFKPSTDVIVNATAYAPGGKPLPLWRAGVRVGALQKRVTVTGPRAWVHTPLLGWSLTEPVAVRQVPLRYELAFGGEGFEENPVGKGYLDPAKIDKSKAIPAPQILPTPPLHAALRSNAELERGLGGEVGRAAGAVKSVGGAYPVEGFGAIAKPWQPRRARAGTFDETWAAQEKPSLPADFDMSYWNAAHPDLCVDGFLRGDERVTLTAMHPEHESLLFRLPGQLVAVGLVHGSGFRHGAPARLDTVFIDADAMRVELTWRATMPLFKVAVKSLHIAIGSLQSVGGAS